MMVALFSEPVAARGRGSRRLAKVSQNLLCDVRNSTIVPFLGPAPEPRLLSQAASLVLRGSVGQDDGQSGSGAVGVSPPAWLDRCVASAASPMSTTEHIREAAEQPGCLSPTTYRLATGRSGRCSQGHALRDRTARRRAAEPGAPTRLVCVIRPCLRDSPAACIIAAGCRRSHSRRPLAI